MNHPHSEKIIPARRVRIVHAHEAHAVQTPVSLPRALVPVPGEPKITLIRDGQTVIAIEVQCACGAITRLDCQY